jgi:hypothetical protein
MSELTLPRVNKTWFILGDALLVLLAAYICLGTAGPLTAGLAWVAVAAVGLGAWIGVMPWLLEYRALTASSESDRLADTVSQIKNLETIARQIGNATAQWQTAQELSSNTTQAAKAVADQITEEALSFSEFIQKASSTEKATLRLEVDKLRRMEADWLQVTVRMLDHVFALHQAAMRSGQRNVIDQITQFQNACRDAARRVGLTPFAAAPDAVFEAQLHRLIDEKAEVPEGSRIEDTIAPGFTLRGEIVRQVLVKLKEDGGSGSVTEIIGGEADDNIEEIITGTPQSAEAEDQQEQENEEHEDREQPGTAPGQRDLI